MCRRLPARESRAGWARRAGAESPGGPGVEMEDLSLHILDIAENAVAAGARRVDIRITEDVEGNWLTIEVADDGKGMSEEALKKAADPFYSTKHGKKVGLGLSLLSQAANEAEGSMEVSSAAGRGTRVKATFRADHIDCKPLGDMAETLSVLIAGNPHVRFTYEHSKENKRFFLDTDEIQNGSSRGTGFQPVNHGQDAHAT